MKTTEIGRRGESAVCDWLHARGYEIVERNFHIQGGEIDIIAKNKDYLAFVEVKTRKPNSYVSGYEAVTKAKQKRLVQAAAIWCAAHPDFLQQPRFDIAIVEMQGKAVLSVTYLTQAFDATDSEYIF